MRLLIALWRAIDYCCSWVNGISRMVFSTYDLNDNGVILFVVSVLVQWRRYTRAQTNNMEYVLIFFNRCRSLWNGRKLSIGPRWFAVVPKWQRTKKKTKTSFVFRNDWAAILARQIHLIIIQNSNVFIFFLLF